MVTTSSVAAVYDRRRSALTERRYSGRSSVYFAILNKLAGVYTEDGHARESRRHHWRDLRHRAGCGGEAGGHWRAPRAGGPRQKARPGGPRPPPPRGATR